MSETVTGVSGRFILTKTAVRSRLTKSLIFLGGMFISGMTASVSDIRASTDLALAQSASVASGEIESGPRRISGASPYTANCLAADLGEAVQDSEVEPHLAVDPKNSDHLIAAWQQDRFVSGGGARNNIVAMSKDRGETWTVREVPGISACSRTKSEYSRATDPHVTIGADGTAYLSSLSLTPSSDDAELVSASPDGGIGWNGPALIDASPATDERFLELEAVEADPVDPRRVFMVYTMFTVESGSQTPTASHIYYTFSSDRGRSGTWTKPTMIAVNDNPAMGSFVVDLFAIPAAGINRPPTLVVSYETYTLATLITKGGGPVEVKAAVSHDLGRSWQSVLIGAIGNAIPPVDVERPAFVIAGASSAAARSGADGTIYFAWKDSTSSPVTNIWVREFDPRDTDPLGPPILVHTSAHQAFQPSVAVSATGRVGVSFYDFRSDTPDLTDEEDALLTDRWLRYSEPSNLDPEKWQEVHLGGPFDMRQTVVIPVPPLYFVGDYQGLIGLPDGFGALFSMGPPMAQHGPTDIFFRRVVTN